MLASGNGSGQATPLTAVLILLFVLLQKIYWQIRFLLSFITYSNQLSYGSSILIPDTIVVIWLHKLFFYASLHSQIILLGLYGSIS